MSKLYESEAKKATIYVHELSSFGLPDLERYPFMGRDNSSLILTLITLIFRFVWHNLKKLIISWSCMCSDNNIADRQRSCLSHSL